MIASKKVTDILAEAIDGLIKAIFNAAVPCNSIVVNQNNGA